MAKNRTKLLHYCLPYYIMSSLIYMITGIFYLYITTVEYEVLYIMYIVLSIASATTTHCHFFTSLTEFTVAQKLWKKDTTELFLHHNFFNMSSTSIDRYLRSQLIKCHVTTGVVG